MGSAPYAEARRTRTCPEDDWLVAQRSQAQGLGLVGLQAPLLSDNRGSSPMLRPPLSGCQDRG
eukprot:2546093-Prorocentrum_lima.AAC.1